MTRPVRLRLSRARGFDLQAQSHAINGLPCAVVSRPSRFGNPHRWQDCPADAGPPGWAQGVAVKRYAEDLLANRLPFTDEEARAALGGRNLACWCALCPAHAAMGKPLDEACLDCAPCHADPLGRMVCAAVEVVA